MVEAIQIVSDWPYGGKWIADFEDKSNSIQKIKMNCILNLNFWFKRLCMEEADSTLDFLEALWNYSGLHCW